MSDKTAKCTRCGEIKPLEELSGYNLDAPEGKKFEHAYCSDLSKCKSPQDTKIADDLIDHLG